jgi:Cu2+-exporting ATPase
MKTTVIKLEGIDSVLSPAGVEKHMCTLPRIYKVETNFMTGSATVYHDDSVTLADIKKCVADCGYGCSGECLPEHLALPDDPPTAIADTIDHTRHDAHSGQVMPAVMDEASHAAHDMSAQARQPGPAAMAKAKVDAHAAHEMSAHVGHPMLETKVDAHTGDAMSAGSAVSSEGEMAAMAHEMGHGSGMSMEGMVRDMRNRFLFSFMLSIPIFLYSPLFTETF